MNNENDNEIYIIPWRRTATSGDRHFPKQNPDWDLKEFDV
jgi:hypothetical protein